MPDELGIQCTYSLGTADEQGREPSEEEFGGVAPYVTLRMPPQSLQIQRNMRSEVNKDLGSGISIVTGGEGIGRITIHGTHGVGVYKDSSTPSEGKAARDAMVAFFGAFVRANDARGKAGKPALRMIWLMLGGGWSNPGAESYYVWPENFPTDSRSASRPHAWDWSMTLLLLGPITSPDTFDPSKMGDPQALAKKASDLSDLIGVVTEGWKGALSVLQDVRDLRSKLGQISHRITDFVNGAKDAIYQVTDLARGSAQLCNGILNALNVADFRSDVDDAIRGTVYECRRTVGQSALIASQFKRSGAIQSSLSGIKSASTAVPVSVALSPGDTLQAVAARVLGDSSRWTDLVTANDLDYPFVDFSGSNGAPHADYAGLRVLGASDKVKIPLPASPGIVGIAADPIGRDLVEEQVSAGDLVGGIDNLTAALLRRIKTPRGRIPWHPTYGSMLPGMIGGPGGISEAMRASADLYSTLNADPRVLGVSNQEASFAGSTININADAATPLGAVAFTGSV